MRSFRINVSLAFSSASLVVLTLVRADWIEVLFRVDPDGHSGALEWLVSGGLCAATVIFGVLARAAWHAQERSSVG